jgi:hypothetical protein
MANWAGAAVSLLLVAGIGVWGYQLLSRDVSGVPIVKAVEGPTRVAPEAPGGKAADHQGLAVNSVAGHGVAEAPADRLTLAPRGPGLTNEDQPLDEIVMPARLSLQENGKMTPQALSADGAVDTVAALSPVGTGKDMIASLADQIAGDTPPLSGSKKTDTGAAKVQVASLSADDIPAASKFTGGVAASLRPSLRPASLSTARPVPTAAAAETQVASLDVAPETIPAGTRLVQFGAYASAEIARSEWGKLDTKFGDFLEGKQRVIQKATSGGRTFYRLRALGFEDVADARQFCAAIVAGKAECIPVVTR